MEVIIIKGKKTKTREVIEHPYMMIRMSRHEALEHIRSLAQQLDNYDPNTDRPEVFVRGPDFTGLVSISVQQEKRCMECEAEVEIGTGKQVKDGVCCAKCKTPEERGEAKRRRMYSGIPKSRRSPQIGGLR